MTTTAKITTTCLLALVLAGHSSVAWAQEPPPPPEGAPPPEGLPPPPAMDGGRFRFSIAGSVGGEFGNSISIFLGGLDLHTGLQVNDLLAIYAATHLSVGSGSAGGASGVTATFAITAIAEATFNDRFFVGAGGGFGVLNNPSGGVLHIRGGFYPLMSKSTFEARRRGLMVGLDLRTYFTGSPTVFQIMLTVGRTVF